MSKILNPIIDNTIYRKIYESNEKNNLTLIQKANAIKFFIFYPFKKSPDAIRFSEPTGRLYR